MGAALPANARRQRRPARLEHDLDNHLRLFAWRRWARLGVAAPPAVVQGMLAAIGGIIAPKQLHLVAGVSPEATASLALLAELPTSFTQPNPNILLDDLGGASEPLSPAG